MDLRTALREQLHAGLAMLADCVENCPDELWASSNPCIDDERAIDRSFWRIAFHAAYFTHLYLGQNEAAFRPPPPDLAVRKRGDADAFWRAPWDMEPYDLPGDALPSSRSDIIEYIDFVDGLVDSTVDGLDLDSEDSGFSWYKKISKLSHELLNLRHIQGHVGQLSELLLARGIDTRWIGKAGVRSAV